MPTELLPCPFCGGDAFTGETLTSLYVVLCRGCGAETGAWDTEAEAIAAWNQRTYTIVELDETQGFFKDDPVSLSEAISLVDWTPSKLLAAIGRGEVKLSFTVTGLEPNAKGELHD